MKWKTLYRRQKGNYWEKVAQKYLEQKGLLPLTSNYYSRFGEIDLIMKDSETVVFIEVKYRKSAAFGGAIASITNKKQQNLTKTATIYLQQAQLNAYNTPCRFDVVTIEGEESSPKLTWFKNAF